MPVLKVFPFCNIIFDFLKLIFTWKHNPPKGIKKPRIPWITGLAAEPGFEPGQDDPESSVLPLHNSAMNTIIIALSFAYFKNFEFFKFPIFVCSSALFASL